MQNEIAVQGTHAFMSHIYTLIYITHGAWAIVTEFTIQFYHDGEPSTNEWDTWKHKLTWK